MSRIDVLQQRMFDVMPVPTPGEGPRVGRTRIFAAALAGNPIALIGDADKPIKGRERQLTDAVEQMEEGAFLQRLPVHLPNGTLLSATDWNPDHSANWVFEAATAVKPGAGGVFLDQWGRVLQVPRVAGEGDPSYSKRILTEVISASTTNIGLAQMIDRMLGTTGTEVIDAYKLIFEVRLNDGHRLNDGTRLSPIKIFNAPSLWNCFIVVLQEPVPEGFTLADVNQLVQRRKAGGFRKIGTIIESTGEMISDQ